MIYSQLVVLEFVVVVKSAFIPGVIISHCSLGYCGLASTGAIVLSKALQENKSLEALKYVVKLHALKDTLCSIIHCLVLVKCLTAMTACVCSDPIHCSFHVASLSHKVYGTISWLLAV